jgi:hypothetical protein
LADKGGTMRDVMSVDRGEPVRCRCGAVTSAFDPQRSWRKGYSITSSVVASSVGGGAERLGRLEAMMTGFAAIYGFRVSERFGSMH